MIVLSVVLTKELSWAGFASVPALSARFSSAEMTCCCRSMRSRSERAVGAGAGVAERLDALQLVGAGREVQPGLGVLDRYGRADGDAAEGVDHVDEAEHVDLDVAVDPQPGGLLDGLHGELGAAELVGRVDLVVALAGDVVQVSRGRLTTVTLLWSSDRWITIMVSVRCPTRGRA